MGYLFLWKKENHYVTHARLEFKNQEVISKHNIQFLQKKTTGIVKTRVIRSLNSREITCEGEESHTFQQDLVDCCDPQQFIVDIFKQSTTLEESVLVTIIATKLKV